MRRRDVAGLAAVALVAAGLGVWRATRPGPAAGGVPAGGLAGVLVPGRPTLLDFGRGECSACRRLAPILEEVARRHDGRVTVRVLDLKDPAAAAIASELRVVMIPTQVWLDAEGREVGRHEGFIELADVEAEMARLAWIPAR